MAATFAYLHQALRDMDKDMHMQWTVCVRTNVPRLVHTHKFHLTLTQLTKVYEITTLIRNHPRLNDLVS